MATTFEQLVPAPRGRFDGIERPYSPADVERLRGSVPIACTLADSTEAAQFKTQAAE